MRDMEYYGLDSRFQFAQNSDVAFFQAAVNDIAPTDKRFFSYVLNVTTHSPHFNSPIVNYNTATGQYSSGYAESLQYVLDNFEVLAGRYPKLKSTSRNVADATLAYLVSVREYDTAVGVLLEHLKKTGLINTTAIVLYSDHFNYISYKNTFNSVGGGLLSDTTAESPIGEKCVFMIYNPKDKQERKIKSFMSSIDIYKTVAQLYGIQTHNDFTFGSSVIDRLGKDSWRYYEVSVGVGFNNGLFFGTDLNNPDLHFATRDFRSFTTNVRGVNRPSNETVKEFKKRADDHATVILKTRRFYDRNLFRDRQDIFYGFGERR